MPEVIDMGTPEQSRKYVRAGGVVVLTRDDQVIIRSPLGRDMAITKNIASLRRLLEYTFTPHSLAEIAMVLQMQSASADELVRVLIDRGVLEEWRAAISEDGGLVPFERICLGVCGSISSIGTPAVLTSLKSSCGVAVEVIMTAGAQKFVNPGTIEHLGFRVWRDPYTVRDGIHVPHAWLAESCGMILIAPASASTIHRIASGSCTDLLSLVIACTRSPVVLAPGMHPRMWNYGPIRRNLDMLKEAGMYILEPVNGFSVSAYEMQVGACAVTSDNIVELLSWLGRRVSNPPNRSSASEGTIEASEPSSQAS